jgi:DNA-binding beta-propeller fold protein YncE
MPDREQGLPTGVTLGPMPGDPSRSALWIPDTHYYRVAVYDPQTGTPVTDFGTHGTGPGQFIYLTDIAVLTDDAGAVRRVYVSEYGGNDRVSVFDASLTFLFSFGRFGVGTPERQGETLFNRPQSLDIDPARGEVVVADACNHRLGRFTLDGELIAWIGAPSAAVFSYPYGVRLLEGGRALVAEFGGNRVSVVDLDSGRVVERLGEAGREPGAFAAPWGVAVVGDEAYILDSGNNRVQVIESPGRGSIRYPAPSASRGRS